MIDRRWDAQERQDAFNCIARALRERRRVGLDRDGRILVDVGCGMTMHLDVIERIEAEYDAAFGSTNAGKLNR